MPVPAYEQLTLFPVDSPANPSPWLENKREKGMIVTYGRKCAGLSKSLSRVAWLVRTYLESCELPLPTLQRTWSVSDITSSCLLLKLRLSERSTEEQESHLWPTVTAMDSKGLEYNLRKDATSTRSVLLSQKIAMYATPQHRDFRTGQKSRWEDANRSRNLNDQVGGQLNPTWVEWLMGFPIGWTELDA